MKRKSNTSEVIVPILTVISDVAAIESAFIISFWLRFYSPLTKIFPYNGEIPPIGGYLAVTLFVIPVWVLIFQTRKLYRPRRTVFIFDEFFLIARLSTFAIIFAFGLIFFYRNFPYSRLVFILVWLTAIFLITFSRYIVLKYEKNLYNKGRGLKKALIVGNNSNASDICNNFSTHPYAGFDIIGFIEADNYSGENYVDNKVKLGRYSEIANVIKENQVEILLVAIPSHENEKLYNIMKLCEGENVEMLLVPDFLEMITSSVRVQEIDGIPFLKIKSIPMNIWNRFLKRSFDFTFAAITLLISSPIFLLIALFVKITSKGPVFYKQERISFEGKKFDMIKFRSMVADAEKDTGAVFVAKNDSRYTTLGRFLRKYSLDELPQFINVLKGDMSIVGPRPEREYFINLLKEKIPKYLERHRVKCGITGWAQVNGLRGSDTSLEKRLEYDIYYIENWSIVFDMKIILKTLREMFFSKAAF